MISLKGFKLEISPNGDKAWLKRGDGCISNHRAEGPCAIEANGDKSFTRRTFEDDYAPDYIDANGRKIFHCFGSHGEYDEQEAL